MRIVIASLFVALVATSSLVGVACSGAQSPDDSADATSTPVDEGTATGALVDDGAVADGPDDDGLDDSPDADDTPTTQPSVERVTVSIRFHEPPSEQTLESLTTLGVQFSMLDGEPIAVGTVYSATVPEGMIEALEATAEIADIEVSGERPIVLPDTP